MRPYVLYMHIMYMVTPDSNLENFLNVLVTDASYRYKRVTLAWVQKTRMWAKYIVCLYKRLEFK